MMIMKLTCLAAKGTTRLAAPVTTIEPKTRYFPPNLPASIPAGICSKMYPQKNEDSTVSWICLSQSKTWKK